MNKKEAFKVLGLSPGSTTEQAKKKYRELAKKYHPDRVQDRNLRVAEKQMKQVNAAFKMVLPYLGTGKPQNKGGPESLTKSRRPVKESLDQFKKQFFNKINTLFNAGQPKPGASSNTEAVEKNRPSENFDEILRKYASQFSKDHPAESHFKEMGRFRETQTPQYRTYVQLQKRYAAAAKKRSRAMGVEPAGPIRPVPGVDPVDKI